VHGAASRDQVGQQRQAAECVVLPVCPRGPPARQLNSSFRWYLASPDVAADSPKYLLQIDAGGRRFFQDQATLRTRSRPIFATDYLFQQKVWSKSHTASH
jgi:hypothetical protein